MTVDLGDENAARSGDIDVTAWSADRFTDETPATVDETTIAAKVRELVYVRRHGTRDASATATEKLRLIGAALAFAGSQNGRGADGGRAAMLAFVHAVEADAGEAGLPGLFAAFNGICNFWN